MVNAKIDYYEHTIDSDGNDDADDAADDVAVVSLCDSAKFKYQWAHVWKE